MTAARDEATASLSLVDEIIAARTEQHASAEIFLDGEAWSEAVALREQIAKERRAEISGTNDGAYSLVSQIPVLEAKLMEKLEQLEGSKVEWEFQALSRNDYQKLMDAHPTTNPDHRWDNDTFPPALVSASCIGIKGPGSRRQGGMAVDDVDRLWTVLDQAQTDTLFGKTYQLQIQAPAPFTYAAIGPTTSSEPSLIGASGTEESPTAGS